MMMSTTIEKVRMDDDCHNIGIAPSFGITLWAFLRNATLIDLVIVVDSHRAIIKFLIAK